MRAIELNESFVNLIGNNPLKMRFCDQVWDLLQNSYASIGGIRGSGFDSKESLLSVPFWKVVVKDQQVQAVVIYKDSNGRKSVAIGSNGTPYARKALAGIMSMDLDRAYGEKSKSALGFTMKNVPWEILQRYAIAPDRAEKILGKPITPIKHIPQGDWPSDAQFSLNAYPVLLDYGYLRRVGPDMIFKVMFGTPEKFIR